VEILIQPDAESGCVLAAHIVADLVRRQPSAVLGLSTGRTPMRLYAELIRLHREEGLSLAEVTTFNLDEYVGLEATHPQSYRCFMNEHLFDHIDIDPEHTNVPNGVADDLLAECRRYEAAIAAAGGIDLQVLGIGRNGHIGFNEPTGSLGSRTWIKILAEQTLIDNSAVFGDVETIPRQAITMGIGTILDTRHTVLLAFGEAKAGAVADAVEGPVAAICPASALQLHPRATLIIDEAASAQLRLGDHYRWIERNKMAWQRTAVGQASVGGGTAGAGS
jgi:glucosamine-6-phosphate deaminase